MPNKDHDIGEIYAPKKSQQEQRDLGGEYLLEGCNLEGDSDQYIPVEYNRRADDGAWLKSHHYLVGYVGTVAGFGVWIFTTFAQVNWVNAENRKQDEMFELQIHEANKKMDYLIRLNEQQQVETSRIKETLFTLARDRR